MGLEKEDLEKIGQMISSSLEETTATIKEFVINSDKGLAASLKNEFKGKLTEFESKLSDDKGSDDTGDEDKDVESPAMKAMRRQIEELREKNLKAEQKEKDNQLKAIIDKSLSGQNVNQDVRADLVDKLFNEWKDSLDVDNGEYYVKQGADYKPITEASRAFVESPRGSIYLKPLEAKGTGKKTTGETGGNGRGDEEKTVDSLLLEGIGELFG